MFFYCHFNQSVVFIIVFYGETESSNLGQCTYQAILASLLFYPIIYWGHIYGGQEQDKQIDQNGQVTYWSYLRLTRGYCGKDTLMHTAK